MTKQVKAKNLLIGGGAPVSVQSMTNTDTRDVEATQKQIDELTAAGADLVRVSVYNQDCVEAFSKLKTSVPLCADIHFDYQLAISVVEKGADKLRINPGNIGAPDKIKLVADCARAHGIPIRVGVNSGSLQKNMAEQYGNTAKAMVLSAMDNVRLLENAGFHDIVVSLKASDVRRSVEAYRKFAQKCVYPLHLGITEAGTLDSSMVKSAIGIGSLLLDGIGDTMRVSITGDPVQEVRAAKQILRALGIRKGLEVISCPTCGRTGGDIESIVREVKSRISEDTPLKIAVMGCVVNGPGEAKEADIGIAYAKFGAIIFKKGELFQRVDIDQAVGVLINEAKAMAEAL